MTRHLSRAEFFYQRIKEHMTLQAWTLIIAKTCLLIAPLTALFSPFIACIIALSIAMFIFIMAPALVDTWIDYHPSSIKPPTTPAFTYDEDDGIHDSTYAIRQVFPHSLPQQPSQNISNLVLSHNLLQSLSTHVPTARYFLNKRLADSPKPPLSCSEENHAGATHVVRSL